MPSTIAEIELCEPLDYLKECRQWNRNERLKHNNDLPVLSKQKFLTRNGKISGWRQHFPWKGEQLWKTVLFSPPALYRGIAVEVWDSSTKVPSSRDDMASSKSRHTSAAFNNLRQGEKHPRISLYSIASDKRDTYQKHTVLKYIAIYCAVIIVVLGAQAPAKLRSG